MATVVLFSTLNYKQNLSFFSASLFPMGASCSISIDCIIQQRKQYCLTATIVATNWTQIHWQLVLSYLPKNLNLIQLNGSTKYTL